MITEKISFIGGGNMAQALIAGLLAQGVDAAQITVSEPVLALQEKLTVMGLTVCNDNLHAVQGADIVLLAVKPQVIAQVLQPLAGALQQQLLISIVAGVPVQLMADILGGYRQIVRVMPNTPAQVQCGMSGLYADKTLETSQRQLAEQVLSAVGQCVWVEAEQDIDSVTAISGSGPAYFFYLMEAMIQAGKNLGLDAQTAKTLTLQTALGAAKMAIDSEFEPAELRRRVTSPNGTTQAALEVFEQQQISQHIQHALAAAKQRSQSLAKALAHSLNTH